MTFVEILTNPLPLGVILYAIFLGIRYWIVNWIGRQWSPHQHAVLPILPFAHGSASSVPYIHCYLLVMALPFPVDFSYHFLVN